MPISTARHRRITLGRRFNLLWTGQAVSQLGDYVAYLSIPLFVKFLTDSSFSLAVTYSLETAPVVLVGFAGGVLIDRVSIRGLMILTDLLRAAAFGFLAWVASSNPVEGSSQGLGAVFVVAFAAGTLAALFGSALLTIVPRLVPSELLASANSRIATTENLANVLGPALAGLLVGQIGFWPTFVFNALTFVVSAVSLTLLGPVPVPDRSHEPGGFWIAATNGLRFLWREGRLRTATLAIASANLVLGFIEATFVLAAEEVIGATETWQQGMLFGVLGAGAVLGAVLAPAVIRRLGLGRTLITGLLIFGVTYTIFANLPFGVVGSVVVFVAFIGFQFANIPFVTIRQTFTPSLLLGRVITASRAIGWLTLPVGALTGAAIAEGTGSFALMVRWSPLAIVAVGLALIPTVLWRDTFGPGRGGAIVGVRKPGGI